MSAQFNRINVGSKQVQFLTSLLPRRCIQTCSGYGKSSYAWHGSRETRLERFAADDLGADRTLSA